MDDVPQGPGKVHGNYPQESSNNCCLEFGFVVLCY